MTNRILSSCLLLLILLILGSSTVSAQQFANFYPAAQGGLTSAIPLSNGDILVCGGVPMPNQHFSAMLMRLGGNGVQKWAYRRNDTTYSHFTVAQERAGGQGYVVAGWSELNPFAESASGMVALVDTNGVVSNLHYAGGNLYIRQIRIMGNGDLHFGGSITGATFYSNPPAFLRTTSGLNVLQSKVQQVALSTETGGGTDVTADGWITMANARSFQFDPFEMAFSRHSPSGAGSFYKYITCGQDAQGKAVTQISPNTHLYLGVSTISGVHENVLLRLDGAGNVLMAKKFHHNPALNFNQATSMKLTHPDSVLIWGTGAASVGWICRADTLGNVVWMRDYAIQAGGVTISDVGMFPNGDLLVTGATVGGSMLLRTGPTGLINCAYSSGLGTNATFTQGATSATSTSWIMSVQTGMYDSIVHRQTLPIVPPPADACNPPCSNSIQAQTGSACIGNSGYYCSASPFASAYAWTFNGAAAGTASCLSVTYNGLGPADTLGLTSVINGCTTTTSLIVNVGIQYTPAFTQTINQLSASFTNTTPPPFTSVLWQFGDGSTSTAANPSHTYATPGTYNVCLNVTGACGTRIACHTITVSCPAPTASFTSSGSNLSWAFTSTVSSGFPVTYNWTFGDGGTSSLANPTHNYGAPGTYNVCLNASSSCGVTQACTTLTVTCPLPTASISASGNNLVWNFTSTVSSPSPVTYSWDFGDGTTSTAANPTHTYPLPINYTACLTVTNLCGSVQACSTFTVVCPQPVATFTSTGTAFTRSFTSSIVMGTPTSYFWDFDDGNSSSLANPTHVFATSGVYNVCLTVSSTCGSYTWCDNVTISCPLPSSAYTSSNIGLDWSFQAPAPGAYPVTYSWDFGDGFGSSLANPIHTYAASATYNICLTATSVCGSTQTCIVTNVFAPPPILSFTGSGNRYGWNFTSNVSGFGPFTYAWTFGNGMTSTSANPSVTYTAPGTYQVCVTVTDAYGNSTTTCMTITVVCPMPVVDFSFSQQGQAWQFLSQFSGTLGMSYHWDFGDGNASALPNPLHTYAGSGLYQVCLIASDSCGTDTACHMVEYNAVGVGESLPAGLRVWPVPVEEAFVIAGEFEGTVAVYDMHGRCLHRAEVHLVAGEPLTVDASAWAQAIYLLQLRREDGRVWTVKLPVR